MVALAGVEKALVVVFTEVVVTLVAVVIAGGAAAAWFWETTVQAPNPAVVFTDCK